MGWVWIVVATWVLVAIGLALLIARSVALADRKEAGAGAAAPVDDVDRPNVVIDRSPLALAPEPPAPDARAAGPPRHDPETIPGLPSARPPVGRPPVPHPIRQRPRRRSGLS